MTAAHIYQRPFGELLRQWREHRRLSQLELSVQAEISTRHLSFLETGRANPSRDMVLHLAEHLDLPLRERNHLLLAGGYAPVYAESALDSPRMAAVCEAIRRLLTAHDPYPAVVVDRNWDLVDANAGIGLLSEGVDPDLLANVLRASLHPEGLAPHIVNLGEWRAHLLGRLRRQIAVTADPRLGELYKELCDYPCDQPEPEVELPGPGDILVPLRVRRAGRELSFFSIVATFGTPLDVTVSELMIESFYPADPDTAAYLRDTAS
ncbi:helix-turn-helix transcriptional regulator [Microbispora corallina]|uniref:Transcriptional regulator n=1 Tax=Microbispora corallina TaxID=83302 RepID=A0ABQ4G866_9ACTN|nr:helix-turn-helix transcriptional regulator [Microbispora corallina]GIH43272.1 transcriptional regulator [Microbispora corallina]